MGMKKDKYKMPIVSIAFVYMNVNSDYKEKHEKEKEHRSWW